jgi:hypothetical protein
MTPHEYLEGVLQRQVMRPQDVTTLQQLRDKIEGDLRRSYGSAPRFYYAGSYGKDTMIQASFDLDIVIYFPPTEPASLRDIFTSVHSKLTQSGYIVQPKTVALRLPYDGGFHVDVVPGKAQDASYKYATLYKNEGTGSTLQTSLKVHIDAVRKTGIRECVKLMKLWRLRHGLSWSTFALEIIVGRALNGKRKDDHSVCMNGVFNFLVANIMGARLVDPANTNNTIDMSVADRQAVAQKAAASLNARTWGEIVW